MSLWPSTTIGQLDNLIVLDPAVNMQISWEILNNDTITFMVSANTQGWLGMGFHRSGFPSEKPMQNVDFYVALFENSTATVYDCYSNPKGMMPLNDTSSAINGTYDIISFSGYQTPDHSMMIFTRKLDTGDVIGDHIIEVGPLDLVWAHGESNTFAFHGQGNSGRVLINLLEVTQPVNNGPGWINYHAGFMSLAFGILMPIGLFVARYMKDYTWWFPLHLILQITAFIFSIIGVSMAIKMMQGISFATNHAILGLTTLIMMLLSTILGATSHLRYDPDRSKTPVFPDIVHWISGRLTILFGFVTIILGMVLHQVPNGIIVCFGILIGFYFTIIVWLEVYKRVYQKQTSGYHHGLINHN
eukprot:gene1108-1265_t